MLFPLSSPKGGLILGHLRRTGFGVSILPRAAHRHRAPSTISLRTAAAHFLHCNGRHGDGCSLRPWSFILDMVWQGREEFSKQFLGLFLVVSRNRVVCSDELRHLSGCRVVTAGDVFGHILNLSHIPTTSYSTNIYSRAGFFKRLADITRRISPVASRALTGSWKSLPK